MTSSERAAYVLLIELEHVKPSIWRRILVAQNRTLATLHHVIQAAFGWSDLEQHEFEIDGSTYANAAFARGELEGAILDERNYRLNEVIDMTRSFTYRYDFDSNWSHRVMVERVGCAQRPPIYAEVLAGARACPPESLGGPSAYRTYRKAMDRDPISHQADEYRRLVGEDFRPGKYDRQAANAALQRLARNGWVD